MNLICTPCGIQVMDGQKVIIGIEENGIWSFGWACCHGHGVQGIPAVVLGSSVCIDKWLSEHPEHEAAISRLLETEQRIHRHKYN